MANNDVSLKLIKRTVTDAESGFPAFIYTVPEGWEIDDKVNWDRTHTYNPADLYARCYNRGGYTIQLFAGYSNRYWATPFGNSGNAAPRDVTDALRTYLNWFRGTAVQFTEATILSSEQKPASRDYNNNSFVVEQYGRVKGHYEKDGVKFNEILYGTITINYFRQGPDMMGYFYEDIYWRVDDMFLSSGAHDRDPEVGVSTASMIRSSVRQTQVFFDYEQKEVNQLQEQAAKIRAAAATNTSNTKPASAQTGEKTKTSYEIMMEGFAEHNKYQEKERIRRMKESDIRQERAVDGIRDKERYTDRNGTEYLTDYGYEYGYVSSRNKYLMVGKNERDPDPIDTSWETWTKIYKKQY